MIELSRFVLDTIVSEAGLSHIRRGLRAGNETERDSVCQSVPRHHVAAVHAARHFPRGVEPRDRGVAGPENLSAVIDFDSPECRENAGLDGRDVPGALIKPNPHFVAREILIELPVVGPGVAVEA